MTTIRAEQLTDEHFGKTLHIEDDYYGRHYIFQGELTSIANDLPFIWMKSRGRSGRDIFYKSYRDLNRETPEFYDCDEPDCVLYMEHEVPGPIVVIELDDDEMLELQPDDEVEVLDA